MDLLLSLALVILAPQLRWGCSNSQSRFQSAVVSAMAAPRRSEMMRSFRYAYQKARTWHSSVPTSIWAGFRYSLTGDTGYFKSHGGWRLSRVHRGTESAEP